MARIYVDTGGAATNSGSSDNNAADLSGSNATVSGSVVTLDGSPDLSGLVTSGASQSSIALAQATNSNRKIFWITAFDNSAKTVTVDTAPTGVTGSGWAIGGRLLWTPANAEGALRPGDELYFNNSPASSANTLLTSRAAGTSSGRIKLTGKPGVRPVFTVTGNFAVDITISHAHWLIDGITITHTGTSTFATSLTGTNLMARGLKLTDAGTYGIGGGAGQIYLGCDISGTGANGIQGINTTTLIGCYIHDTGSHGVESNNQFNAENTFLFSIFDSCAGSGIRHGNTSITSIANWMKIMNCTFYGCGDSGLEVLDADVPVFVINSIFSENGNAAGEYNVELPSGVEAISWHAWNVFHHSGGGGGANLSGLTVDNFVASSEFTTDPSFTNAASGDFSIGSSSPAKAAGFPGAFVL